MTLAFIPARGGSRRIPHKNVRPFLGTIALLRVLDVLKRSGVFDRIVVSSESDEVLECAQRAVGVDTCKRSSRLADDHTTFAEVVSEFVGSLDDRHPMIAAVVPTAVSLTLADVDAAVSTWRAGGWEFVFTAGALDVPVERTFTQDSGGGCRMHDPSHFSTRSQDLPPSYRDAGMIYVGAPDAWRSGAAIFTERSTFIEIPRWRVHDLDTEEDWQRAERVLGAHGMTKDRGLD